MITLSTGALIVVIVITAGFSMAVGIVLGAILGAQK